MKTAFLAIHRIIMFVCAVVILSLAASAKPPPAYRFTELGIDYPFAINNRGEVPRQVGAFAINAKGDVAINADMEGVGWPAPFVWTEGSMHPLSEPGSPTFATAINNAGVIVGRARMVGPIDPEHVIPPQPWMAVLWTNYCCHRLLGTLGEGYSSDAYAINNRSQAVGSSWPTISQTELLLNRPVLFEEGRVEDLGLPEGTLAGIAVAINDHSEVAVNFVMTNYTGRVFVYSSGMFTDLGVPRGHYSAQAWAMNKSGQVVGTASSLGGEHAFLYTDGQMYDLNDLAVLPPGAVLANAFGINDRGEIVGLAIGGRAWCGFLLTPAAAPPGKIIR
jgi:probable HAF family extracellular repeat protein